MITADEVLKRAEAFSENGEFDKARKFYQAVIDRMPDTPYAKQAKEGLEKAEELEKEASVDFSDLEAYLLDDEKAQAHEDAKNELQDERTQLAAENPAFFKDRPKPKEESEDIYHKPVKNPVKRDYTYQARPNYMHTNASQNINQYINAKYPKRMKRPQFVTWKLVSGILSIVFCLGVMLASCTAGFFEALQQSGQSGAAGIFVSIFMLTGGIVSIATRKNVGNGGNIALAVIFILAAMIGFSNGGLYEDLVFWAAWCLICGVLAVVAAIKNR